MVKKNFGKFDFVLSEKYVDYLFNELITTVKTLDDGKLVVYCNKNQSEQFYFGVYVKSSIEWFINALEKRDDLLLELLLWITRDQPYGDNWEQVLINKDWTYCLKNELNIK